MSRRDRIVWFGLAAALVAAGAICAVLIAGGTGQILALILISLGLVLAVSLVFLEVGLSEDRERARAAQSSRAGRAKRPRRIRVPRLRGHRPR
jgi:membrane protein implicated in regulation of membrane protease activity